MLTTPGYKRWITAGLLASTVLALAAPAFADGRRRYKGVQSSPAQRVYVQQRSSNAGPILAGLVGGFLLGAAVTSHAQSAPVYREQQYNDEPYYDSRPSYRYYDPYGDDWYDSLDQYSYRSGPQIMFVIDIRSGQRVRSLQYRQGHWNRCDDSVWRGSYGSRGWDRQRYDYRSDNQRRYRDDGNRRDRYAERSRDRDHGRDDRRSRSRDDDSRRSRSGDDDGRRNRGSDNSDD